MMNGIAIHFLISCSQNYSFSHLLSYLLSYALNYVHINPLSTNPIKWPNTLKQFVGKLPTNCLSVFGHFVNLELKGLIGTYVRIAYYH